MEAATQDYNQAQEQACGYYFSNMVFEECEGMKSLNNAIMEMVHFFQTNRGNTPTNLPKIPQAYIKKNISIITVEERQRHKYNKLRRLVADSYSASILNPDSISIDNIKVYQQEDLNKLANEELCQRIILCENTLQSVRRKNLILYYNIGKILTIFKSKQKGLFKEYIKRAFKYSIAHGNKMIRFYKLALQYPNILRCAISFKMIIANFAMIKEICNDLSVEAQKK